MAGSYRHLSLYEREEISRALACGWSLRAIARKLGRPVCTVSREVARNSGGWRGYRAVAAQRRALRRARRVRRQRKLTDRWLRRYVLRGLRRRWSPQQIAERLRRDYPEDMRKRISHETIYAALYVEPRGELRRQLLSALRQPRPRQRRRRHGQLDARGRLPNMTPLSLRPVEASDRTVPGHWEGDLLKGSANRSAVGTLVERTTRLVLLAHMDGIGSADALAGFSRKLKPIPAPLRKTLTYDRGTEMACHQQLAKRVAMRIFFTDPHSPWQRASNENTNGLLRQYLPKNADLSRFTQAQLNRIANEMNGRPRQVLNWDTPLEAWAKHAHQLPTRAPIVALGT